MNSPGSQRTVSPIKKNRLLRCGNRHNSQVHNRTVSMPISFKDCMYSEPDNSCDTIPEIPQIYCPQMAEPPFLQLFPSRNSLVMKNSGIKVRVRKRRVKKMKTDELFSQLLADSQIILDFKGNEDKSFIPVLGVRAEFFKSCDFEKTRERLKKEYFKLVNG